MTFILERLRDFGPLLFSDLFDELPSRQDVIAAFMALLELMRIRTIRARQKHPSGDIRLVLNQSEDEAVR